MSATDGRFYAVADASYRLEVASLGIALTVDRLRRDRHELVGELSVKCDLKGAHTVDGYLSVADFNLSSATARVTRAKLLAQRSRAEDLDWVGLLEELCVRTIAAERQGSPSQPLDTFPDREGDDAIDVDGWPWLRDHTMITFADGGGLKSYLALWGAGVLVQQGLRVGYADWELTGVEHKDRLCRLFAYPRPTVHYFRCDKPLVDEADRLLRESRRLGLDYMVFDSAGFGTAGPPEAAEHALAYFRALRQIGVGAHLLAHVNRSDTGDQKPFGSSYWHNSARATWFAKHAATSTSRSTLTVGLFNRKHNLGKLHPALAFTFDFDQAGVTTVTRANVGDVEELAQDLPLWQRIAHLLKSGGGAPLTVDEIASALEAKPNSVMKAVSPTRTGASIFVKVPGTDSKTRIALVDRR